MKKCSHTFQVLAGLALIVAVFSHQNILAQTTSKKIATIGAADTLYMNGKWEEARKIYEANVSVPTAKISALTWHRLGYAYHNLGNYNAALKNYKKSLELKPVAPLKPVLQSRVARIYALTQDKDKAFEWLDSAVRSGYASLNEFDTLKDLSSLRKDKRFEAVYKGVYTNAYPCSTNLKSREFDFWIGEWDVYVTGTTSPKVGHSLIQNVAGECLILENWTALGQVPNTGKSMNYYDTQSGKWEQVWMGSGGRLTRFLNGVYTDNAMRFTFEPVSPTGQKGMGRFVFFNQGPNQVRQFQERSVDEGKTWQPVYDFTYVRRK